MFGTLRRIALGLAIGVAPMAWASPQPAVACSIVPSSTDSIDFDWAVRGRVRIVGSQEHDAGGDKITTGTAEITPLPTRLRPRPGPAFLASFTQEIIGGECFVGFAPANLSYTRIYLKKRPNAEVPYHIVEARGPIVGAR